MSREEQQSLRIQAIDPEKDRGEFAAALAVREVVFIEEQQVPPAIERDVEDARAYHLLAWDGPHAVGTGRLIELDEAPGGRPGRWGQIGRMAVLTANRSHGVGRRVLEALEEEARRRGLRGIKIHAQVHAMPFYEKAGYRVVSEPFDEAGIPHVEAIKDL